MLKTGMLLLISATVLMAASAGAQDEDAGHPSDDPARMNAVGGSIGLPQFIALQYERILGTHLALELNAGTVILLNSFGGRLALGSTSEGFRPRVTMGMVALNMNSSYQESPSDMKTILYSWPGAGVAWRTPGISASLDLGWIFSAAHETGWASHSYPAASLSLMARF